MQFTHKDVTPDELAAMAKHHRKSEYNPAEMAELYNITRKYVNQHIQSCFTCSNNLRDAKTQLNTWYLQWKDEIEARHTQEAESALKQPELPQEDELTVAEKQVKEYSSEKKKRKKK